MCENRPYSWHINAGKLEPLLLTWISFIPGMNKCYIHYNMWGETNYLGKDEYYHPTPYCA